MLSGMHMCHFQNRRESKSKISQCAAEGTVALEVFHDERCEEGVHWRGPGGGRMGTTFKSRN